MLERLDGFMGRWAYRAMGLVVAFLGGAAAHAGYLIVAGEGRLLGLLLLVPGVAAALYGLRLMWTAGGRRLSDMDF